MATTSEESRQAVRSLVPADSQHHQLRRADDVGCRQEQETEQPADFLQVVLACVRFTVSRCDVVADCRPHQRADRTEQSGGQQHRGCQKMRRQRPGQTSSLSGF